MSDLLQRIAADFEPNRRRTIEVPEWGKDGVPLVIHYDPITLADQVIVTELDGEVWPKRAARFVVMKSLKADGSKLFNMADATFLMTEAKPDVVNRIALAMIGRLDVETAAKN